jgi:hypothetical protein
MASGSSVDSPAQGQKQAQRPPVWPSAGGFGSQCANCSAALAHDQRYCVECGARAGPLPHTIVERITAAAQLRRAAAPGGDADPNAGDVATGATRAAWATRLLPGGLTRFAPPAMAVSVMSLLCFGVVIGAEVSPATQSPGPIPVAVTAPTTNATAPAARAAAGEASTSSGEAASGTAEAPGAASTNAASTGNSAPANNHNKGSKGTAGAGTTPPSPTALPPIKHVFLIVLSDQGFQQSFGAGAKAPYLSQTLPKEGELVDSYYAVAGGELANEVALISGQGPTAQLEQDCPTDSEIVPGTTAAEGQVIGSGCVYPQATDSLANELTSANDTWTAYIEGQGVGEGGPGGCSHPTLGSPDSELAPTTTDGYVTWRNPFVYFQSLTESPACASNDLGIATLAGDLTSAGTTPTFAYIAPDPCDDGSEVPCAAGKPGGLAPAEAFLKRIVPEIESSPAYKQGGLIAITFDQAPQSGPYADSTGCCMNAPYPNARSAPTSTTSTTATATGTSPISSSTTTTTATGTTGVEGATVGGGRVGLLLISKYVKPGTRELTGQYNHFSLLRTIENLFGLKPLGYAGQPGLLAFDKSVFNAYK